MSCIRCNGFFTVTPMYCCCKGHGRYELSKTCNPFSGFTRINVATSSKFGSVAERPTKRTISCVVSTCRTVLAMMDSSTGPRSSCKRWTSSMMISLTSCVYTRSPDFRVIISHFSGVVTMICVASISALLSETSPVNSRTWIPNVFKRLLKLPTISATRAFIGATYTILNADVSTLPSRRR